jgi:hypothetical protein
MAEQVGNGFEPDALAVKLGGKSVPEQMNLIRLNTAPFKGPPDRSAHMMSLQGPAQGSLMSNKESARVGGWSAML